MPRQERGPDAAKVGCIAPDAWHFLERLAGIGIHNEMGPLAGILDGCFDFFDRRVAGDCADFHLTIEHATGQFARH